MAYAAHRTWQSLFHPGDAIDFFQIGRPGTFAPEAEAFCRTNAWLMSELCRLIYKRGAEEIGTPGAAPGRNEFLETVGLKELRFFNGSLAQCALVHTLEDEKDPFAVLVFRGSSGGWDVWRANLRISQSPWPRGGMVHSGFKRVFDDLWALVAPALEEIRCPLFYTGHSLGAALATMAASLRPPRGVYTFGSPRVGNRAFADTLGRTKVYRIVHRRDIISAMPPSLASSRFCHVGETEFVRDRRSEQLPAKRPGPAGSRASLLRGPLPPPPIFLASHAPANYTTDL